MTRRAALAAGAAAAVGAPAARAASGGDAAVMARAVRLEQLLHAGLTAGVVAGVSAPSTARRLAEVARHDLRHAQALAAALEALGGPRPRAPRDVNAVDALARALGAPALGPALAGEQQLLEWAVTLKRRALEEYAGAAARLLDVRLVQTVATVLASDAQHLAVLRERLGESPVPASLETAP